MKSVWLALLVLFITAGCARQVREAPTEPDAAFDARAASLAAWSAWGFTSRLSVDDGDEGGSGRLDWRVSGDDSELQFRGALGQGAWQLEMDSAGATLRKAEAVGPSAYLVKPFQEEVLRINVALALKKSAPATKQTEPEPEPSTNPPGKLFVRDGASLMPLDPAEIALARGEDNYTRIQTASKREYLLSSTLKTVEQKLSGGPFCRIHKSYLVNLDYIDLIEGTVLKIQGQTLPIGKTYRAGLMQKLDIL